MATRDSIHADTLTALDTRISALETGMEGASDEVERRAYEDELRKLRDIRQRYLEGWR